MYSCGIKISGSIFLSLQQNLCEALSTVIITDIQKLNFSVSDTQFWILSFQLIALSVIKSSLWYVAYPLLCHKWQFLDAKKTKTWQE
jgi:hypothetical protein